MDPQVVWRTDRITRTVYATDNSIYQVTPERVGLPASIEKLSGALRENYVSAKPTAMVARGGGTGTNGQSLTDATVIDLKRSMNQIVHLDVSAREVVVEPGIVAGKLNEQLAQHGLFWPPHTSTLNRATVGGMISTDAAGKGSLVYGRAHRHVKRLTVLLDDGTPWVAEPVTQAEALLRAEAPDRSGELWGSLLELPVQQDQDLGLPALARGFSGYGVDRFRRSDIIDPVALLCGSEGTLGIVVQATLSLSPLPQRERLVVASYPSFNDALDDAVELRSTQPTAIEAFDETTLVSGRSSPAWSALGSVVGDHQGAVLLLEYTDGAADDLALATQALEATGRSVAHGLVDDPARQEAIWKVRADAVGLLAKINVGSPKTSARPTAFVEDCAVPVEAMPQFIAAFRQMLDEAGLRYAMFGHADVGCVHVRPALDLTSPSDQRHIEQVTSQVIELVAAHGGVLWGEHGRGYRGADASQMLSASTLTIMRQVKTAFDPLDIFNPGKLYRPLDVEEPLLGVLDPPLRGAADAEVPVALRNEFDSAFACNGNGLCHHHSVDEVMCPSYTATSDPAMSPRGRVDLLRSWLGDRGADRTFERELAANLHQCLSCSACSGRCPVEVDIPELKSRFLEDFYRRHRRPLRDHLLSHFERIAMMASRAPWLASLALKPMQRMLDLVDLPSPQRGELTAGKRFSGEFNADVVLLPDVFTSSLESHTVGAALVVLDQLGYRVKVAPFVASGKFDHVKGRRKRFAKAVRRQAEHVRNITESGAVPVVIEPAVALLHRHEYPIFDPSYPTGVVGIGELIMARADRLQPSSARASVLLLGHCTERALQPRLADVWVQVLVAAGYDVSAPEIGCCGMAGVFGHEASNQEMSQELWDMSWHRHITSSSADHVVATGFSCRSQAERFGGVDVVHPLHLLEVKQSHQIVIESNDVENQGVGRAGAIVGPRTAKGSANDANDTQRGFR